MSNWKGIVGKGFRPEEFQRYVATLFFAEWRPQFVVLHNTSEPRLLQWHRVDGRKRMRNLEQYYRNPDPAAHKGAWSAGPHLFIADDLIWVFTPLTTPGVHSPSWNGVSWGVEMVGEFDEERLHPGVRDNTVEALAVLHAWRGIDPATLRFHKEDKCTTHKNCPGKFVDKADIINRVRMKLAQRHVGEHIPGAMVKLFPGTPSPATPSSDTAAGSLRSALLAKDKALAQVVQQQLVLTRNKPSQHVLAAETVQDALNLLAAATQQHSLSVNLGVNNRSRGYFGPKTEAAVRAFQLLSKIDCDGRVDRDTILALDRALLEREKSAVTPPPKATPDSRTESSKPTAFSQDGRVVYTPPIGSQALLKNVSFDKAVLTPTAKKYLMKFAHADQERAHSDPSRCMTLLRFPHGIVFFQAKMAIDADGSPRAAEIDSPENASRQTSHRYRGLPVRYFNAEEAPYIVLPLMDPHTGDDFLVDMGLRLGDVTMVIHRNMAAGAIVADRGPAFKIGEGSIKLHEMLGQNPWTSAAKRKIKNSSIDGEVLYFVFPDSAIDGLTPDNANDLIQAHAAELYHELVVRGEGSPSMT